MSKNFLTFVIILILLHSIVGCSSIEYRTNYYGLGPTGIYPGVREGIDEMGKGCGGAVGCIEWLYDATIILDLPVSFIVDTLCLPFDVFLNWEKEERQAEKNDIKSKSENSTSPTPK